MDINIRKIIMKHFEIPLKAFNYTNYKINKCVNEIKKIEKEKQVEVPTVGFDISFLEEIKGHLDCALNRSDPEEIKYAKSMVEDWILELKQSN